MALATLRILRMAIIVFKEFTQPVKKLFVNIARNNDIFRKYICKPPAQGYHWCENSLVMLLSKDTGKKLNPLTEEEFIHLGAAILAELVVFICCSKVVLLETNRHSKKKDDEEKILKNREEDIIEALTVLEHRLKQQNFYIEQIIAALGELNRPIEHQTFTQTKQEVNSRCVK